LLYYLPRHRQGLPEGVRLPRSTRTIWKILRQHHRIAVDRRRLSKPLERPEPLQEIQMDFKDDSTVPAEPLGKRQHVVETCNFVDAGTSIWLHAIVREDFTAETAFDTLVEFLQRYGLPAMLTFDRDPRLSWAVPVDATFLPCWCVFCSAWASSPTSARRIDQTKIATLNDCIAPTSTSACSCIDRQRQSKCVRSPTGSCTITTRSDPIKDAPVTMCRRWSPFRPCRFYLPFPSRWIRTTGSRRIHGRAFARTVRSDGTVTVDDMRYYVKQELAGQVINLIVDAPDKVFDLFHGANRLKRLPLKGLYGSVLPFEEYVTLMRQEARSDRHRPQFTPLGLHQTSLWA
jgi:hypothetical protein